MAYGNIKDRRRVYEQKHRERGICISCSNVVAPGRSRCESCLAKMRVYDRKRYLKRKSEGICVLCGLPLTEVDKGYIVHNRNECKPSRRLLA